MRGGYPLALPLLSSSRPTAPKAQPRRAAGYKNRFADLSGMGWMVMPSPLQHSSELFLRLPQMPMKIMLLLLGTALLSPASALGASTAAQTQWEFWSPAPGAPECAADKRGAALDTHVLRTRDSKLALLGGHPDWNHWKNSIKVTLSIDGGPPVKLTGDALGSVVLVEDDRLENQLKAAHTIEWVLPWGHFTANVDGLGQAFDKLPTCP